MIRLTTPHATLELYDRFDAPCSACHAHPGELGIDVIRYGDRDRLSLCPTCMAEALAIQFGRQHVIAGGQVADLTFDTPAAPGPRVRCNALGPTPALSCELDHGHDGRHRHGYVLWAGQS